MKRTWRVLAVALTAALVLGTMAVAQPAAAQPAVSVTPAPDAKGQVILSWSEFVQITGYDPSHKGGQTLTIPFAEVQKLLGVQIDKPVTATVDLPWTEFKALLEWSVNRKDGGGGAPPPTDFVVTSTEYKGTLSDEKADFAATFKINILREKGWKRIALLPATVAVTKVTVPEGAFVNVNNNVYELLTEKTGPLEVTMEFSVAVEKTAGVNQVSFPRAAAGSAILDLMVDRQDVDVKVAQAQKTVTEKTKDKTSGKDVTYVAAAVPSGAAIMITWERALPKVEAAPTKMYAETRTLVGVADGMFLCDELVNYNILHTGVRELKLQAPAGASVLAVSGPNVQDWRVDKSELTVVLKNEVLGGYSLRVSYEAAASERTAVPVLRTIGTERETGFIAVVAVANVEIEAGETSGATAVDVRQLPAEMVGMTNQPILLAFRYVEPKVAVQLAIKKHEEVGVLVTLVDSSLLTAMQMDDGRRITKAVYTVRNNRNQFLRLQMPVGAEIWSVSVGGNTVSPAKDEKGNLLIPLVRSATSAAELASFPVEIVYVEAPAAAAPDKGKLHVVLPGCAVPVMHVMYSYYLPADGDYTIGWWGASGFSGPLRVVPQFAALTSGPTVEAIKVNAEAQAQQMQQQADVRVDAEAKVAGATPIRVRLPLNGKLFKLEKILALPQDQLWFEVQYSGWKPAK
jgi:hypothetical protein